MGLTGKPCNRFDESPRCDYDPYGSVLASSAYLLDASRAYRGVGPLDPYGSVVCHVGIVDLRRDSIVIMPSGKQPESGPLSRAFSARVHAAMEERGGVTITALAQATGVSRNYLSKRLRNEVPFTLNDVEAISRVLRMGPPAM